MGEKAMGLKLCMQSHLKMAINEIEGAGNPPQRNLALRMGWPIVAPDH